MQPTSNFITHGYLLVSDEQLFTTASWTCEERYNKGIVQLQVHPVISALRVHWHQLLRWTYTQLSTFMFWMEVFMSEWNLRKHHRRAAIRQTTLKLFQEHQVSIAIIEWHIWLCLLNHEQFMDGNENRNRLLESKRHMMSHSVRNNAQCIRGKIERTLRPSPKFILRSPKRTVHTSSMTIFMIFGTNFQSLAQRDFLEYLLNEL